MYFDLDSNLKTDFHLGKILNILFYVFFVLNYV